MRLEAGAIGRTVRDHVKHHDAVVGHIELCSDGFRYRAQRNAEPTAIGGVRIISAHVTQVQDMALGLCAARRFDHVYGGQDYSVCSGRGSAIGMGEGEPLCRVAGGLHDDWCAGAAGTVGHDHDPGGAVTGDSGLRRGRGAIKQGGRCRHQ